LGQYNDGSAIEILTQFDEDRCEGDQPFVWQMTHFCIGCRQALRDADKTRCKPKKGACDKLNAIMQGM